MNAGFGFTRGGFETETVEFAANIREICTDRVQDASNCLLTLWSVVASTTNYGAELRRDRFFCLSIPCFIWKTFWRLIDAFMTVDRKLSEGQNLRTSELQCYCCVRGRIASISFERSPRSYSRSYRKPRSAH